jgi:hypothetical protein
MGSGICKGVEQIVVDEGGLHPQFQTSIKVGIPETVKISWFAQLE